ncbi:hypothetical protein ACO0QE_002723 [Hanseniaspora vineae]
MTVKQEKQEHTVIVLNTDTPKEYLQERYGDFADQGIHLMKKCDQDNYITSFKVFNCFENKLPTIKQLSEKSVVGIYITGSVFDSYSNEHEWIINLRKLLKIVLTDHDQFPPVFAVCFGHQIVGKVLGSEVVKNPKGLEEGLIEVVLNEKLQKNVFDGRKSLYMSETHNDIVLSLPEGYENIGSTPLCTFQGFYQKGKLMSWQGHPEFNKEILLACMKNSVDNGYIKQETYDVEAKKSAEIPNEGDYIGSLILKLFKGEI